MMVSEKELLELFRNADERAKEDAVNTLRLHPSDGRISLQTMMDVRRVTAEDLCSAIGMSCRTLKAKMKNMDNFTMTDMAAIKEALQMSRDEAYAVFFA